MRAAAMRSIDNLGRIVLPKELRDALGLEEGTKMDVFVEDNGAILLQKALTHCLLCGSATLICNFDGKALCKKCIQQIREYEEV